MTTWPRVYLRRRAVSVGGPGQSGAKATYEDWGVDLGLVDGHRKQYFRATEQEANALAAELRKDRKELGDLALALSPADKLDAVKAIQLLAGKTTLEAAAREWIAGKTTLLPIRTVAQVQNELVAAQVARKNRDESIAATRTRYASFIEKYGMSPIAEIRTDHVTGWIESQRFTSDVTRANVMRYLAVFFNFAVKRGYINTKSPMAGIERPRVRYAVPEFIPVADVERLMRGAEKSDKSLTARLAIGVFSGLRPAELERLQPSDIDIAAKVIHVRPEVAKTGRPRHVTMSDNLTAWLAAYPFDTTNSFDERRARVCKAAGVEKWPHDALRHTFASHHLAMWQDAGKTSFELGHERDSKLLYKHYAGLVGKKDAERFWELRPNAHALAEERSDDSQKRVVGLSESKGGEHVS